MRAAKAITHRRRTRKSGWRCITPIISWQMYISRPDGKGWMCKPEHNTKTQAWEPVTAMRAQTSLMLRVPCSFRRAMLGRTITAGTSMRKPLIAVTTTATNGIGEQPRIAIGRITPKRRCKRNTNPWPVRLRSAPLSKMNISAQPIWAHTTDCRLRSAPTISMYGING